MGASNSQKAVKGMSSQTFVTLLLGIIEIVSFSIMSRLLSQEDFGYYAAITAITTVFATFSETGMGASIIQRKDITPRFVNNAFTISFFNGLFLSILLILLAYPLTREFVDASLTIPLMVMSIPLFCNCLISVQTSIMKRRLDFLKVGFIDMFSVLIASIIAIVLAWKGMGFYAIISKVVISSLLATILSYKAANTKFAFQLDKATFNEIFKFSGWLTASVFLRNLATQLDRLLMTNLISVNALGAYNRPKEFINNITSKIGGIFDTALFPILSQIQDNKNQIKRAYIKSMYIMNLLAVVISLGFIFNGELIIRVFFGEKWLSVLSTFQILSIYMVFHYDGRLADCFLRSLGLTQKQFYFRFMQLVICTIGILLSYKCGINGIAISVVLCDAIMVIAKHFYLSRIINITLSESFSILVKTWKVSFLNIPIMFAICHFATGSIAFCMITAVCYILIVLIEFVLYPQIVGRQYVEEYYSQLRKAIEKKFFKK